MNTDRSIILYIRLLPIVSIVILMTVIMLFILNMQKNSLTYELVEIKNIYVKNQERFLKNRVKDVVTYINYEVKNNKSKNIEELKESILKMISTVGFSGFSQNGYIHIVDSKGTVLTSKNSKNIDLNKELKNKINYDEYFKKFDWTISAGVYDVDIDKIIQKEHEDLTQKYKNDNIVLVIVSILIALIIILISIFLSRRITKIIESKNEKVEEQTKQLANIVKEKTSKLRHHLSFTNKLINTIPVPIFVKDEKYKFIDCNQAFCDFLDLSKKEIIGKKFEDVGSKFMAEFNYRYDRLMIKNNLEYLNFKYVDVRNDKTYEFYKARFLHKKEIDGIIGIIFDITKKEFLTNSLKQEIAEKTIQNLEQNKIFEEEQLKNIKFTAIGQLAAGITHEINTPLTYIMGSFEMMGYDISELPDGEIKDRMNYDSNKINDGLKRIANIIESMREMSQKSKEEKEVVNIYHTLVTSLTMAFNRSKQIAQITLNGKVFDIDNDKDSEVYNCFIQRQRVEQVWVVIVNNALDELVNIEGYDNRKLDITIEFSEDKDEVIVRFKDNAGGIDDELINSIFEPFISSKEYGGMGVGLNIAKKIIDDQDGIIEAYNDKEGATFEVRLKNSDIDDKK